MSSQNLPSSVPNPPFRQERCVTAYSLAQWYVSDIDGTKFKVRLRGPPGSHEGGVPSEGLHIIRDKLSVDSSGKICLPAHRSIAPMSFAVVEEMIDPATERQTVAIVSPFYDTPILQKLESATLQRKIQWMLQICEAVEALHKENIAHGNIHPRNIIVHHDGHAVLTDTRLYSFAAVYDMCNLLEDLGARIPYPLTLACKRPSTFQDCILMIPRNLPTKEDDVFALVTTLWTLLEGKEPWDGRNTPYVVSRINCGGHRDLRQPAAMSDALWQIVKEVFKDDPKLDSTSTMRQITQELGNMRSFG